MNRLTTYFLTIGLVFSAFVTRSQDFHSSQYDVSPVMLNPAYTGVYRNADLRAAAQFRTQWASVARKFVTTNFAFDVPFKDRWGLGGYMTNYDAAKLFNSFSLVAGTSYNVMDPNSDQHRLTCGLQLGFIYKTLDIDEFVFDQQYDEGNFNSYLPSGETLASDSRFMPEVNLGFAYANIDYDKTVRPYIGASVFHILRPREGFVEAGNSRLPIRWVVNGGTKLVFEDITFDPKVLFMYQREAMELMGGFSMKYDIEANIDVLAGFMYRHGDAVIPSLGLDYYGFQFLTSYDINISDLKTYTNGRGGIEFSIVFLGLSRGSKGSNNSFAQPRPY